MKILCVSDYVDPLIYNQNVMNNFSDIDIVLCAGDLPMDYVDFIVSVLNKPTFFIFGNHNLKEYSYYHKTEQKPYTDQISNSGLNHGHGAIYLGFKTYENRNITYLSSTTNKETPLLIAGASGSSKYNKGLCQYTNTQMLFMLIGMIPRLFINKLKYGRYLDIFLTHTPPRHIHDKEDPCHIGFDCYNWFLQKFKPKYMVHGHIHLYDLREERISQYEDTTVVNAYAHCVIEL
ncbi:MAG: metallophosphoesterase [Treponema sp.]|jgi:uncharacterized protein|nr:metallophosphoesterase [Treponema sp.]